MAYTNLVMEHPVTGHVKKAPVGFSWTVLFFGFMPALFRADWKWALIMLILSMITMGFSSFVFMFIYNKLYIRDLVFDGFKVKSVENNNIEKVAQDVGMKLPML